MTYNGTQVWAQEALPGYTYTGQHTLVNDGDGNWRIKLLTSGTLTLEKNRTVDFFLVGGGGGGFVTLGGVTVSGGGGGGGYTRTVCAIPLYAEVAYAVTIGAGGAGSTGAAGGTGGETTFIGSGVSLAAAGGAGGNGTNGGDGGTGGAGSGQSASTDGANGAGSGGTGQGTTTREFGDATRDLYASGGDGLDSGADGAANTGNGGGGKCGLLNSADTGGDGGSGILILRPAVLNTAETDRIANEAARVSAENRRIAAENSRVTAETARETRTINAADLAVAAAEKLSHVEMTVDMLSPGAAPQASVTQSGDTTSFALQIPKSDLAYATFEVTDEMALVMHAPAGYQAISFALTADGALVFEIREEG